jgi:hypothetical protein
VTTLFFIFPQLFFHSIIVKSKEYGIKKKQALDNNFSIHSTQTGTNEENINTKIYNLLGLIYLSLYQKELEEIREWLVDLKSILILIFTLILSTTMSYIIDFIFKPIFSS